MRRARDWPYILRENSAGPSLSLSLSLSISSEREKGEPRARDERKVALLFVLAVAGREIVLHARIASKRRRLHRGKKKERKKKKEKKERIKRGKKEKETA
jgi:hypothetical protein